MKIEYHGRNEAEDRDYREAYITYDENKEQEKADELFEILGNMGWRIEAEEGCASIFVHDKEEYEEFVVDYKNAKKRLGRI